MPKEYRTIQEVAGPLMLVRGVENVAYDELGEIELVSGENGLDRGVSWPNIAQTVSIREWLVGGDVILMSGVGLKITDEFLTDIVIQAADGRAACIIMLINPEHIASIPQAAIDEAVKRGLAVFAAPWETKLSRVIGSVSMLVSNDVIFISDT